MSATTYPRSPRLLRGGFVLLSATTGDLQRVIPLQYNPESLRRSFQVKSVGGGEGGGNTSDALRLTGPPVESYQVEAELDAADALEVGSKTAGQYGLQPQLAALETLIYPTVEQLRHNHQLAAAGTLEIVPMQGPLTLFVWSRTRVLPVRVTELSIQEKAYDPNLNPIRATVSLGLRVLSMDDLGFAHKGGTLFLAYQQLKESLSAKGSANSSSLASLGLEAAP